MCRRATSRMRKINRNPASKDSSGLCEKAKGGLPVEALAFFNKLGWSRSLWTVPWQQAALFGSESLWIPTGGAAREEEKRRSRTRSRANLNGGEQDCEKTWGTHKGSHKRRGALSQGQPKWWRAGRGTVSPMVNSDMDAKTKWSAQFPDRPKWRRAGARACHRSSEEGDSKPGPT